MDKSLISLDEIVKWQCSTQYVKNFSEHSEIVELNSKCQRIIGVNTVVGEISGKKSEFLELQKNNQKTDIYRVVYINKSGLDINLGSWWSNFSYSLYYASFSNPILTPLIIKAKISEKLIESGKWGDYDELFIPEEYITDPSVRAALSPISIGIIELKDNDAVINWYSMPKHVLERKVTPSHSVNSMIKILEEGF